MFRVIFCHLLDICVIFTTTCKMNSFWRFFQMCWQNHQLEMYMASPKKKWPQHVDMTPKQNKFTEDVFSPPSGFDVLKVGGTTQRCLKERGGWTAGEMTGGALHGSAGVFFESLAFFWNRNSEYLVGANLWGRENFFGGWHSHRMSRLSFFLLAGDFNDCCNFQPIFYGRGPLFH